MRKKYEKYSETFPSLLGFKLTPSDYLQYIKPLENGGRSESSICFAIWKSYIKLLKHVYHEDFWDAFRNEICKWSWGRSDPRWIFYRKQKEAAEQARQAQIDAYKDCIQNADMLNKGCVYFIQSENGGPIKVGYTTDLPQRLASLQTGFPEVLVVKLAIPGTLKREQAVHHRLNKYWLRGEWYKDTPEVREAMRIYGERYAKKVVPKETKP